MKAAMPLPTEANSECFIVVGNANGIWLQNYAPVTPQKSCNGERKSVCPRTGCPRFPWKMAVNSLMGTLKPQSSGPLYSSTVIGTLAVDGWAVTFGTARRA